MPRRVAGVAPLADQEARIIREFGQHYGIQFRDPQLLKLALTHRSYLHVSGQGPRDSNERLEFLGDSVLGLVTSEFLYRSHPSEHEGQLTKTKSLLVSKAILSRRALAMGLGRFVLMSHSEVESGGRQRLSILADAFESVVGAIYLDQGFESARAFIERWLLRESRTIAADKRHTNYKSHLQEYVQSTFRTHPVYRIRSEMGPDHSKQFSVEVVVGRRVLGEGKGRNKKEAEQAAARDALDQVGGPSEETRPRRRIEPPRPDAPAPAPAVEDDAGEVETDVAELEGGEEARSRRRGRRGGRNRRRNGTETPTASATPSAPPRPAVPRPAVVEEEQRKPKIESRRPLLFRRDEPRTPRPVELEPPPRSFEEDETEEVGRPEGPHEELHVDPYAWENATPEAGVPDEIPESSLPRFERVNESRDRAHVSDERSSDRGEPVESFHEADERSQTIVESVSPDERTHETSWSRQFEPETVEEEAPATRDTESFESERTQDAQATPTPESPHEPKAPEPKAPPPAPHYGRRPGRSRR